MIGASSAAVKLPIPRLARPNPSSSQKSLNVSISSVSSAASTPPPATPPSSSYCPLNVAVTTMTPSNNSISQSPTVATPAVTLPRPKTSHTTIERRYRTNLNARIQSLRMAVPALRVLEDREGGNGKKIKKNIKGGVVVKGAGIGIDSSQDGTLVDVIDERGFVDGVKVARKCSKANVLGKAVEYIRVLKKREARLKAEQAGLKALISGLVGGPALVGEWENQWRNKFGGEEKDEVEGEDEEADDDESEDEDGDDGDEEGGRKRKRSKVSSSSTGFKKPVEKKEKKLLSVVAALAGDQNGNAIPEKRKRGRPRKVLPPPVTLNSVAPPAGSGQEDQQDEVMQPPDSPSQWRQQQQSQPQQFLLAAFALFSFFNSPLTGSTGHGHHHTGKVLTPVHPPLVYAPEIVSQFVTLQNPAVVTRAWKEYVQFFHLFVSLLVLASFIWNWFGFSFGRSGLGVGTVVRGTKLFSRRFRNVDSRVKSETKTVGGIDGWIRLGEESVLEGGW